MPQGKKSVGTVVALANLWHDQQVMEAVLKMVLALDNIGRDMLE